MRDADDDEKEVVSFDKAPPGLGKGNIFMVDLDKCPNVRCDIEQVFRVMAEAEVSEAKLRKKRNDLESANLEAEVNAKSITAKMEEEAKQAKAATMIKEEKVKQTAKDVEVNAKSITAKMEEEAKQAKAATIIKEEKVKQTAKDVEDMKLLIEKAQLEKKMNAMKTKKRPASVTSTTEKKQKTAKTPKNKKPAFPPAVPCAAAPASKRFERKHEGLISVPEWLKENGKQECDAEKVKDIERDVMKNMKREIDAEDDDGLRYFKLQNRGDISTAYLRFFLEKRGGRAMA
jgi:myosin heavy subunit